MIITREAEEAKTEPDAEEVAPSTVDPVKYDY
jgi:hypothetical protein